MTGDGRNGELIIAGLDKGRADELMKGLKEQLFALEGHQDTVLIEYIMVLLASGKDAKRIKGELGTFMSSSTHSERLVRWLFDRYNALKGPIQDSEPSSLRGSLKSVVVAATGASVSKPTRGPTLSARHMLKDVVDSAVRRNQEKMSSAPPVEVRDARDIINLMRRPSIELAPIPLNETENMPAGEKKTEAIPESSAVIEKKSRCPEFPNCPLPDDKCPFVHPKDSCKYFPNCMYGKDCLFLHPSFPCRFGDRCSNQFCNFTHPLPGGSKCTGSAPLSVPCRFNERCRRPDCPFLHTVSLPCPQGAMCMRPACPFTHPVDHMAPAPRSLVNRPCRFGRACAKADCPFQHPSKTIYGAESVNKEP